MSTVSFIFFSDPVNADESMLITDMNNLRVLRVKANTSTGVIVASAGPYLQSRRALNASSLRNVYVIDSDFCLMTRYYNGSRNESVLFGTTCGPNLTQINDGASFCMDKSGNFYVADNKNHRIVFWAVNASRGILLAGTTQVSGSDLAHLQHPEDVTLDEELGYMYVADTYNHRILQYRLNSSLVTVVAGGNGPGIASKSVPSHVYVLTP